MKKIIVFVFLFSGISNLFAQSYTLTEGQSTLLYSLPKTELNIVLEIEKTTQKMGVFYQYSERYLATNQVVLEDKVTYKLKSVSVKPKAITDQTRTYAVPTAKNSVLNLLSVNEIGLLCGVNVPVCSVPQKDNAENKTINISRAESNLLPLGEEYMMAGSNAKLAEGAAKQIYRIRESRMSLLTADVEKLPADGDSFKTMLDGLSKMETELTELFVGKVTTEIQQINITTAPEIEQNNQLLFRLSAFKGLVSVDDLSGTPFYLNVVADKLSTIPANSKAKESKLVLNTIIPTNALVTIGDGVKNYFSQKIIMPQFGLVVPIGDDVLSNPTVKITIDPQTGRLLGVQK